jgi:hypothetical protein
MNDDSCEFIIENTITECNRVLYNWKLNKKNIDYDDKISLFRSYLAKFFKQKFGYAAYHRYIRAYTPLVVIENYMLIDIDFNVTHANCKANIYLVALSNYTRKMDILKFSQLQEMKPMSIIEDNRILETVDYTKIANIRFN